jgi:methyl-accepting chemotaxis protein
MSLSSSLLPGFVRRSYQAKFVLALVVITLFIGAVGYQTFTATDSELTQVVEGQLTTAAEISAVELERWYDDNTGLVATIASNENLNTDTENPLRIRNYLRQQLSSAPADVQAIHYVDTESKEIVVSTNENREGRVLQPSVTPWADPLSFTSLDTVRVSRPYQTSGERVMGFVAPVPQASNRAVALVVNTSSITSTLSTPLEGSYAQVVNADGTIIMDQRGTSLNDQYGGGAGADATPVREGLSGSVGVTGSDDATTPDGVLVARAPVEDASWVVLIHTPESTAFQLRSTISRNLLLILVTALGGLALLGLTLGRSTVRSLRTLKEKAKALEEGDLDVEIEATREDEIGDLTRAFDNMRGALKEQIESVRTAREEAEQVRAEVMDLNEHLLENAEHYSEEMARCASGDLTRRLHPEGENEAMHRIAEDFNEMMADLERTIGQLKGFADEVAETSEQVLAGTDTVSTASEQVAESIQKISDDARDQKERLEYISEEVAAVKSSISESEEVDVEAVRERITAVTDHAEETAELSEQMMSEAQNVAAAAEEQTATLTEVDGQASDLQRHAEPLGSVLNRFDTDVEVGFRFGTERDGESAPAADMEIDEE